jgi:Coenzyme PQQ synthesis protein D (PqqD)
MSAPLSLTSLVKLANDLISAPVDGEVVILSVERGTYYGLDEIGTEIWQRLDSPVRVDVLCEDLAAKYAADRRTIERDVLTLLESLLAEGLVTVSA